MESILHGTARGGRNRRCLRQIHSREASEWSGADRLLERRASVTGAIAGSRSGQVRRGKDPHPNRNGFGASSDLFVGASEPAGLPWRREYREYKISRRGSGRLALQSDSSQRTIRSDCKYSGGCAKNSQWKWGISLRSTCRQKMRMCAPGQLFDGGSRLRGKARG